MSIENNLLQVKEEIHKACLEANRNIDEVTLIAVSKTKPVTMLQEAYDCGCRHFGENKVQEIMDKYDKLPNDINWHMIGHLQTNKVKYIIDKVCLIHSVDSLKLAKEINKEAIKKGVVANILLEVNIADEDTKYGFKANEVLSAVREISLLEAVNLRGLMTVAPYVDDANDNKPVFEGLHKLLVDINNENIDNINMDTLSMGMTGDYTVAIKEGSTFVRVGTGIFGERDYSNRV